MVVDKNINNLGLRKHKFGYKNGTRYFLIIYEIEIEGWTPK